MKKLIALLLAAATLCCFAACGSENEQPASGVEDSGSIDGSGVEAPSSSEERQAPTPTNEGAAYKLLDLQFYLPTAYIPSQSNTETANQRYYTVEDGGVGSGTVITVMYSDVYDGFDLEDYAKNRSLASISRTAMYSNGFNRAEWYTGEWATGSFDTYFFVGASEKYIYEIKIERGDDNFMPAVEMLKETVFFG